MTYEELLAELEALLAKAKAAAEDAEAEGLSDEELARAEELQSELDKLNERRARVTSVQERAARNAAPVTKPLLPQERNDGVRDDDDAVQLRKAFEAYVRTGQGNADITQLRAQGEGVPSKGGYLVPDTLRDKFVERKVSFGGLLNNVEQFTTATGNTQTWPVVDDTATLAEITPEHTAPVGGADLVFGQADIGAYKYSSVGANGVPLRISFELAQDAAFDIEGLVKNKLGERIHRKQARDAVRGTGVNMPQGIITGRVGVEIATNTGVVYDDLIEFIHSIDPEYREGAKWGFNDNTLKILRKFKDSHGDPVYRDGGVFGDMQKAPGGGTLLGFPVVIDQAFPDIVPGDNTVNWGVFGNLAEGYVWRNVQDLVLIVNPYTRTNEGEIEYSMWARADGTVQNPFAYSALTGQA